MKKKKVMWALAMIVVLGIFLAVSVDEAFAQKSNAAADKNIAQKKGIRGALQTSKPEDEQDSATKLQMAIGVGSLFVMIAVMKYT